MRALFIRSLTARCLAPALLGFAAAGLADASVVVVAQTWSVTTYDDGYRVGYDTAYAPALEAGKARGVTVGTSEGDAKGREAGYAITYEPTFDAFHSTQAVSGYASGYVSTYLSAYDSAFQRGVTAAKPVWASQNGGSSTFSSVIIRGGFDIPFGTPGDGYSGADYIVWRDNLGVWDYSRGVTDGSSAGQLAGDKEGYALTYKPAFDSAFTLAEPIGRVVGVFEGAFSGAYAGYQESFWLGVQGARTDADPLGYEAGWNSVFGIASPSYRDAWTEVAPMAAPFYDPRAYLCLEEVCAEFGVNPGAIPEPTTAATALVGAALACVRRRRSLPRRSQLGAGARVLRGGPGARGVVAVRLLRGERRYLNIAGFSVLKSASVKPLFSLRLV